MVPPFGAPLGAAAADSALLSSLLEPHAATPSTSTHRAASEAINRGDLNTLSLFDWVRRAVEPAAAGGGPEGDRVGRAFQPAGRQPVTDLWCRCEKGVKAPRTAGSRSPHGCG